MTVNTHQAHIIKRVMTGIIGSVFLAGSLSASAILPTPAPEMAGSNATSNVNSAAAQGIQTKTVAAIVQSNGQGQQSLKPIDSKTQVHRGDVIEYRSYITNTTPDRIRSMTVTMSIPTEVKLLGDVTPNTASASLDGVQFGYMPLQGEINGRVQDIPLDYYRHLSWTIESLGLNETAMVKYRTVIR